MPQKSTRFLALAVLLPATPAFFWAAPSWAAGGAGFGYDPLFVPAGQTLTFAELPETAKHALSHRGRAWTKLAAWLRGRDDVSA